jgi:hypothetical protein
MVSDQKDGVQKPEDILVVDQEGVKQYSAKENDLDLTDIPAFIREVFKDLQIEDIANSIYMKYIYPQQVEEEFDEEEEIPEEEEFEEEEEEELPDTDELEGKDEHPIESKVREAVTVKKGGVNFDVGLLDDGSDQTILLINGKEFHQSSDFLDLFRNAEGKLDSAGAKELALDILSTMSDEEFEDLKSPKKSIKIESFKVCFSDGHVEIVECENKKEALLKAVQSYKGKPILIVLN